MKNLKIGLRLGIGFAIVLALLLIVAVMGSLRLGNLQAEITDIVGDKNGRWCNKMSSHPAAPAFVMV